MKAFITAVALVFLAATGSALAGQSPSTKPVTVHPAPPKPHHEQVVPTISLTNATMAKRNRYQPK